MGPTFKDFLSKTDPFGRHIPYSVSMEVPPRGHCSLYLKMFNTFASGCLYYFSKFDDFEIMHKTCSYGFWMQFPLN